MFGTRKLELSASKCLEPENEDFLLLNVWNQKVRTFCFEMFGTGNRELPDSKCLELENKSILLLIVWNRETRALPFCF